MKSVRNSVDDLLNTHPILTDHHFHRPSRFLWNIRAVYSARKFYQSQRASTEPVLDIPRTRLLIAALENKLDEFANEKTFRRRLSNAYYDGRTDYDTVETILGREEAMRLKLLRASVDQTSTIPKLTDDLPSDDTFYDGGVAEWSASSSSNHLMVPEGRGALYGAQLWQVVSPSVKRRSPSSKTAFTAYQRQALTVTAAS